MTMIKSVLFDDFGDLKFRDRDLGTIKSKKKRQFLSQKLINLLITIKWLNVER